MGETQPLNENQLLAKSLADRLVPIPADPVTPGTASISYTDSDREIYLPDIQLAVDLFGLQSQCLQNIDGQFYCLHAQDEPPLPIAVEIHQLLSLLTTSPKLFDQSLKSVIPAVLSQAPGPVSVSKYPIATARNFFHDRLADFLAVRFAARQSNISNQPGLQFTVTTNTHGLRVYYSAAYLMQTRFVLNYPTSPAAGWIQPGRYYFGAGVPGQPPTFDMTAYYDVPPSSTAFLAM